MHWLLHILFHYEDTTNKDQYKVSCSACHLCLFVRMDSFQVENSRLYLPVCLASQASKKEDRWCNQTYCPMKNSIQAELFTSSDPRPSFFCLYVSDWPWAAFFQTVKANMLEKQLFLFAVDIGEHQNVWKCTLILIGVALWHVWMSKCFFVSPLLLVVDVCWGQNV